ncbi:hypothetical protein COB55_05190 [Candidatus Wolfebacteria bacterium]|nr:MAG: hypothetical protein COB55_05190 [Candidatus Wolfebacteria bacterium]
MHNLNIDLDTFPFYKREIVGGKRVANKCGRDFLYYALTYYLPSKYGKNSSAPSLEQNKKFGTPVSALFAWTMIQFRKMPQYLISEGLGLSINGNKIRSFSDFIKAILFSRMGLEQALCTIETAIDEGRTPGVDISIAVGGLLDHVMFVYGYDEDNLYVFETTEAPIKYVNMDPRYPQVMKLSKEEIKKRWTRFGRVWEVSNVDTMLDSLKK